jgi:hypothetical protein
VNPPSSREVNRRTTLTRSERRSRNRRRTDLLPLLRALLALVLALQCVRVALASPRLTLVDLRVAGSEQFSAEDLIRIGDIGVGENVFRTNLVRVSENLRREPLIAGAVVTRELPGALRIELTEREPAFVVSYGQTRMEADRTGVVFKIAEKRDPPLPVLQLAPKTSLKVGAQVPPELVEQFWECVRLAEEEQLALARVRIDALGDLWLNVRTPRNRATDGVLRVRVGRATELPEKIRDVRQALLAWPDLPERAEYLNVMCAGRPAYRTLGEQ